MIYWYGGKGQAVNISQNFPPLKDLWARSENMAITLKYKQISLQIVVIAALTGQILLLSCQQENESKVLYKILHKEICNKYSFSHLELQILDKSYLHTEGVLKLLSFLNVAL